MNENEEMNADEETKHQKSDKKSFSINLQNEEDKHKKSLSHYLEKLHKNNMWKNKDVAELLGLDPAAYCRIRQNQINPISNSIITLKKYAYLNDLNILDFIAQIENIPVEFKTFDWLETLGSIMHELGKMFRTELIHNRLTQMMKEDDYIENIRSCFVLLILILDINKNQKWFEFCSDFIINAHETLGFKKSNNLDLLIKRIKLRNKK